MKIKKFDYVEFLITEYKGKQIQKTFPKEEIKLYLGYDLFDEKVTNFLIGQEFSSNKVLEYIDPEDKKNRIEIKLLKHSKTPERFVNLIIELKYLTSQIQDRETTIAKLEQKLNEATTKYNKMEQDFKSQVELMQNKAQQTINEHTKKNDSHMATIINEERKFALQKFLENLINPLNVFETALHAAENSQIKEVATYAKGFEMLYNQIEDVIFNVGVSKIIPKIGDPFDPNIHQIYETIESDHPKDSIIEIKNIGYKLHDRTIRPALVVVAK